MSNFRLRTWLVVLILIAVLPSLVVVLINHQSNQALSLERATTKMEAVARLAAATHEQSVEGVRQILGTISSGPSVRRYDLEHLCIEFIGNVAAASPSYSNIGVLTLEGKARCVKDEQRQAVDFSDRRYFKDALATQQFTVGEYVFGRVSGKKALTYSVPVYDYQNQLKGVAFVGLDLEKVDQRLKDLKLDADTQIFLVNSSGLLLASTQETLNEIGRLHDDPGLQDLLSAHAKPPGSSGAIQVGEALYVIAPVDHAGMFRTFVVARANQQAILGPGLSQLRSQLLGLMASAVLSMLAAWVIATRKITAPIQGLVHRMNLAGMGGYGSTAQTEAVAQSSLEFNLLNQHLSDMLRQLQLHQAAVASSSDGIVICDALQADMPMVYVNPAFERMTGYAASEVLGKNCRFLQANERDQPALAHIRQAVAANKEAAVTIRNYRHDGSPFWNSLRIAPVRDAKGLVTHYVGIQTDVTGRIQNEEELARRANHDWLTGLPNRTLLEDRISLAIERAKREDAAFSIAFIDLDNFKVFNDSIGHAAGDALLVEVGRRLIQSVRAQDTVSRLGGDEFVVLFEGLSESPQLREALRRLQLGLEEPVSLQGKDYVVAASIGLSTFPKDGDCAQSLLQHADIAMYKAKSDGRGVVRAYDPALDDHSNEKLELSNALRKGLANREFELHYQPKVASGTGRLSGFEALVRWHHPVHGLIPPLQFIALAEQTGLIVSLGRWVLEEACAQMQQWRTDGVVDVPVAVNVSGIQFRQDNFNATVASVLASTGLPADRLHIEITESVMIDGQESLRATLDHIRSQGVKIALDDFGTGYSSLGYLKRFPIDYVKIDRSFVRDITTDPADAAICSTIILMAHNLGMQVVAEGVETAAQAAFLREQQCDQFQGYLIGKPKPASEVSSSRNPDQPMHRNLK